MSDISSIRPVNLIIPGIDGSGAHHWQTHWENSRGDCRRVDLGDWDKPQPQQWMARLERAVRDGEPAPITLVAHSLGCILVAWWAHYYRATARKIAGALLVAPCNPASKLDRRLHCFNPVPGNALPFPLLVAASSDDPYASANWSAQFARSLGGRVCDVGRIGHINADSDIGSWAQGQKLLNKLRADAPE